MLHLLSRGALLLLCSMTLAPVAAQAAAPDANGKVASPEPHPAPAGLTYAHVEHKLAQCDEGMLESCVDAGGHFQRGDLSAADLPRANALFVKACDGGSASGCNLLADTRRNDDDHAGAAVLYDRSCLAGSGYACYSLYLLASRAPQLAVEGVTDARLLRQSCALKYAKGCTALGHWLNFKRRDRASYEESATYFTRSCDLGDGEACGELADRIALHPGRTAELPQALALYRRGCNLGWDEACSDGQRLADKGVVADAWP